MYYVQKTGGTGSMLPAAIRLEATRYQLPDTGPKRPLP
jgi:hypothetical protein